MSGILRVRHFAWATALIALLPLLLLAAGFGTLNGKVTDAKTGKPIAGATIKIQIGKGLAAQTSKDGYYLFSNIVPTGKFNITASKDGYDSKTVPQVTIATGVRALNFSLSPKAPPAPAPSAPAPQPGQTAQPKPAQPAPTPPAPPVPPKP